MAERPCVKYPGFRPVSKEAFTAWLLSTQLNVHPTLGTSPRHDPHEGYTSTWKNLRTNEVVGYSTRIEYHLREDLAPQPKKETP